MKNVDEILVEYSNGGVDINEALYLSKAYIKWCIVKAFGFINEDLEQEAMIVGFNCFNEYKESNPIKFTTFLFNKIKWTLSRYIWEDKIIRKPVYLYERNIDRKSFYVTSSSKKVSTKDSDGEVNLIDLYSSDKSLMEHDKIVMIKDLVSCLKKKDLDMLNMWVKGYTYSEIGAKYSKSGSWIDVCVKGILSKVKHNAKRLGYIDSIIEDVVKLKISDPMVVSDIIKTPNDLDKIAKKYGFNKTQVGNMLSRLKKKGLVDYVR